MWVWHPRGADQVEGGEQGQDRKDFRMHYVRQVRKTFQTNRFN